MEFLPSSRRRRRFTASPAATVALVGLAALAAVLGGAASASAAPDPAVEVPKANLELFKKHEAEIKTYAMSGLEMFGI